MRWGQTEDSLAVRQLVPKRLRSIWLQLIHRINVLNIDIQKTPLSLGSHPFSSGCILFVNFKLVSYLHIFIGGHDKQRCSSHLESDSLVALMTCTTAGPSLLTVVRNRHGFESRTARGHWPQFYALRDEPYIVKHDILTYFDIFWYGRFSKMRVRNF